MSGPFGGNYDISLDLPATAEPQPDREDDDAYWRKVDQDIDRRCEGDYDREDAWAES